MSEPVSVQALEIVLDVIAAPSVVDMGAMMTLLVAVPEIDGLDLASLRFEVRDGETLIAEGALGAIEVIDPNPDLHDPREGKIDLRPRAHVRVRAPEISGQFSWQLLLPPQRIGDVEITSTTLRFAFETTEHRTSLAAWDVPSPVYAGERFRFKLGAKCSAGCNLHGLRISTGDASAQLGEATWPDAEGLYWCEMELDAPQTEGLHEIALQFAADSLDLPHAGASTRVSVLVAPPAAHRIVIAVTERESALPICDAQVRFGPHRKATDEDGCAIFDVARGSHRLFVWKAHHAFEETNHDVQASGMIAICGEELPKPNPYARWEG